MGKCCCLILILIVATIILGVSIGVPLAVKKAKDNNKNSSGVNAACQATSYPSVCNETLSSSNATDSRSVTRLALEQTSTGVNTTWADVLLFNGTSVNITNAIEVCNETLALSQDLIADALTELESYNASSRATALANIKAWVSAAMELHTTCIDALLEIASADGVIVQQKAVHTDELFSNALAFVNAMVQFGDDFTKWKNTALSFLGDLTIPSIPGLGNRRLLSQASSPDWVSETDELPSWMDSQTQRHLLQTTTYDVKVAQDGSGNFKTIMDAVNAHATNSERLVIYVKAGTYNEQVNVPKKCKYLTIFGDGDTTIITGNKNVALMTGMTTFKSATLIITGAGFIGKNFLVQNTAGAAGHQAVAVRASADQVAFYQVTFDSFQDTLYAHVGRQFYRDCTIQGTVDFIFGNAAASYQSCTVIAKKSTLFGQQNTYSAQGRTDPHQNTGLAFQNCTFDGTAELKANTTFYKTYLGRPWKPYSVCVILKSNLLSQIDPTGWLPWNTSTYGLYTSYFAEYQNYGPSSGTSQRVSWSHQITAASTANNYIANNFVQASTWVSTTSIPLTTTL